MIHETFHRLPGVEQSHAGVVKDIAVLIPRILVVQRLKCKWSMNEIQIQILQPKSIQARLESRFDPLEPVIGVTLVPLGSDRSTGSREAAFQTLCFLRSASKSLCTSRRNDLSASSCW